MFSMCSTVTLAASSIYFWVSNHPLFHDKLHWNVVVWHNHRFGITHISHRLHTWEKLDNSSVLCISTDFQQWLSAHGWPCLWSLRLSHMGGAFERIWEVADSLIKTPYTWPPWGQSGCFQGDWFSERKLGGNCLALSPCCTHSELLWHSFGHTWVTSLSTFKGGELDSTFWWQADGNTTEDLQGWKTCWWISVGSKLPCKRATSHVEKEHQRGDSKLPLWVNTQTPVESLWLLQLFQSVGPCLLYLLYFRWHVFWVTVFFFECLCCFLYIHVIGVGSKHFVWRVLCVLGARLQPWCQQSIWLLVTTI